MRRFFLIVVGTGLLAAATVALASASTARKVVTPESAASYLPAGVTPCGNDWPMSACDLAGTAYSTLTQINKSNVAKLKKAWDVSLEKPETSITWPPQNQPIVISGKGKNLPLETGTMFLATNTGMKALDPTNGSILWSYQGPLIDPVTRVAGRSYVRTARQEAYGNGMVFVGQQDRSIVALDAKSGKPIWTAQMASYGTFGEVSRQASAAITFFFDDGKDGLLIAATNGGDAPLRGFEDAYNAKTGKLVWRFWNTPDPAQLPFILTWGNPANAAYGGVTIWSSPAIDPELGMVYFDTGNIYPEYGRAPGKDLWSMSLVALNVRTGALKWYFQGIHHDEWDYDCPTPPVLFNTKVGGKGVKGVAFMCKTGYIFELDRRNGRPIFPIPEVKIPDLNGGKGAALNNSWPTQPIPTGGAAQIVNHCPTVEDLKAAYPSYPIAPNATPIVAACPFAAPYNDAYLVWGESGNGGYARMSYSPQTNDLYICAQNRLNGHENRSPVDYNQMSLSGASPWTGSTSALNMATNKLDWQVKWYGDHDGSCFSGVLTTASGLVFTASQGRSDASMTSLRAQGIPYGGYIYAYDAKTGKQLWSWQAEDYIYAPPVTYMVKGKQYLAEYVTGPASSGKVDRLTVFSL
jgi:quinohemoprotein ethanol dehydrogenase